MFLVALGWPTHQTNIFDILNLCKLIFIKSDTLTHFLKNIILLEMTLLLLP